MEPIKRLTKRLQEQKKELQVYFASDIAPALSDKLNEIMWDEGGANLKNKLIAAEVCAYLDKNGCLYKMAGGMFCDTMYYDGIKKALYTINSDSFSSWISRLTGCNRAEKSFDYIMKDIETMALSEDVQEVDPQSYWYVPPDAKASYITYQPGKVVKIDATGVHVVDNGTDGVLFPQDKYLETWSLVDEKLDLVNSLDVFGSANFYHDWAKDLFRVWVLSMFCMPLRMNRPVMVTSGEQGAGKTTVFKIISKILGCEAIPDTLSGSDKGLEDFWVKIDRGGLVIFDNVDITIPWFENALQQAATGGGYMTRKLYTDKNIITKHARSWLTMTTSRPNFASNPAVADRLIITEMNKRPSGVVSRDAGLYDDAVKKRNGVLSWVCDCVHKFYNTSWIQCDINKRSPDFSSIAMTLAHAIGLDGVTENAIRSAEEYKKHYNVINNNLGYALLGLSRSQFSMVPFEGDATDLLAKLVEIDQGFRFWGAKRIDNEMGKILHNINFYIECSRTGNHGKYWYKIAGERVGVCGDIPVKDNSNSTICDFKTSRRELEYDPT